jgi:hypothetical protein
LITVIKLPNKRQGDLIMNNDNPSMCKGIQKSSYNGREICATLTVGAGDHPRTVKVSGRLNNPRKTEQSVLQEICAKVKLENPSAKLVSFKVKEGKANA